MPTVNLQPFIDALTGRASTPARFYAEVKRAKRPAVRVEGAVVDFPSRVEYAWDGIAWNAPPTLDVLPADCYWDTDLHAGSQRIRRTVIVPSNAATVDYADLYDVIPDTAAIDTSNQEQWAQLARFVTAQSAQVTATAATISDLVATTQGQIGDANTAIAAAQALLVTLEADLAIADAAVAALTAPVGGVLSGTMPNPGLNQSAVDGFIAGRIADTSSATYAALVALLATIDGGTP